MRKKFDEQTEMQIVQAKKSGMTFKQIEEKFGCNTKYVQRLMSKYRTLDNQLDNVKVPDNRTLDVKQSDIKKLDVGRLEDKKETSNLSDIKGTEADAWAQGTTTKIATDDRETIKEIDKDTTTDDKQAAEQRPVIIVQAAKDLRNYSSYKDKCRIAKDAINQILNELEFSQWTIDNINSLFDNATRSQRQELEISQEDTKEFFGFDGTYTELQEYLRNKIKDGWLAEVS